MKKVMPIITIIIVAVGLMVFMSGCLEDSDSVQRQQQESMIQEATSQIGMPAIKNFRERKLVKDILEMRDQDGLITYTYIVSEVTGKLIYLGETVGYGIPYSTQFTNPQRKVSGYEVTLPQADPNGLFSPKSAEGTWVLLKDPNGTDVKPVYIEPRIIVSPFKLPERLLQ